MLIFTFSTCPKKRGTISPVVGFALHSSARLVWGWVIPLLDSTASGCPLRGPQYFEDWPGLGAWCQGHLGLLSQTLTEIVHFSNYYTMRNNLLHTGIKSLKNRCVGERPLWTEEDQAHCLNLANRTRFRSRRIFFKSRPDENPLGVKSCLSCNKTVNKNNNILQSAVLFGDCMRTQHTCMHHTNTHNVILLMQHTLDIEGGPCCVCAMSV